MPRLPLFKLRWAFAEGVAAALGAAVGGLPPVSLAARDIVHPEARRGASADAGPVAAAGEGEEANIANCKMQIAKVKF